MKKSLFIAFIITCILISSFFLFVNLFLDPFLRGPDAYYYALQAKYWVLTGNVKIPDSSLIHRVVGLMNFAGVSIEQAICLWMVVSVAIACMGVAAMCWVKNTSINLPNVFIMILLLASPSLVSTAIKFPKMMSAIMLIPLWFVPIIWRDKYWPVSIILAWFGIFLHSSMVPLSLLFSVALIAVHIRQLFKSRVFWMCAIVILAGLAFVALTHFHTIVSFIFNRLSGDSWTFGLSSLIHRYGTPWAICLELAVTGILFLFVFFKVWRRSIQNRKYLIIPISLLIPAFLPWKGDEAMSIAERYAVVLPYLFLIGTAYLANYLPLRSFALSRSKKTVFAGIMIVTACAAPLRLHLAHPADLDPDYPLIHQAVRELSGWQIPMLVAHKSFAYYYKYAFMREAFPYEPEEHWDKTKIWRALYRIEPEELDYYLSDRCKWDSGFLHSLSSLNYYLIREDCWKEMRDKISRETNEDLYSRIWETTMNPSSHRPAFLYPKHVGDTSSEFSALP